jgi:transmembrane sensor
VNHAQPRPEAARPAAPGATDATIEQALQRQRQVLEELFPMPSPAALRPPGKSKLIGGISIVVLTLGCALWWWDPVLSSRDYQSALAQRRTIELPDHSVLTLDAASRLRLVRHLRSWRVELQQGRAGFDVSHSWWRAFVVDVGPVRIRDYGTVFDVDAYADAAEVTLWQGDVAVSLHGRTQPYRLRPGMRVLAGADGIREQPPGSAAAADWRGGKLVCEGMPLALLLRQLQRYHPATIVLADPQLAQLQVSGVFDSSKAVEVLALLPAILPLKLSHDDQGRALLSARDS